MKMHTSMDIVLKGRKVSEGISQWFKLRDSTVASGKDGVLYRCAFYPYCNGMRSTAKQGDTIEFRLRGISVPNKAHSRAYLSALLRKHKLESCLRKSHVVHFSETCIDLDDYEKVLTILKLPWTMSFGKEGRPTSLPFTIREIPFGTLLAARNKLFEYASADEVKGRWAKMPTVLATQLLQFQREGVDYALRRHARCLIADEMGTGKTLQALAIMSCFREEWPLLIVVPASLRLLWAEACEQCFAFLRPVDIHIIFGQANRLYDPDNRPPVVITSYTMLKTLEHEFMGWDWKCIIFDESHKLHTSRSRKESAFATKADKLAAQATRMLLLTGTPSLSRPFEMYRQVDMLRKGLLGTDKWSFGREYCTGIQVQHRKKGDEPLIDPLYDGCRYKDELHNLLRKTVLIRRLKAEVLPQLAPLTRTVVRVPGGPSDRAGQGQNSWEGRSDLDLVEGGQSMAVGREAHNPSSGTSRTPSESQDSSKGEEHLSCLASQASQNRLLGLAKLNGAAEWLAERFRDGWLDHSLQDWEAGLVESQPREQKQSLRQAQPQKYVIFAHHIDVVDHIELMVQRELRDHAEFNHLPYAWNYVRISGSTPPTSRQCLVKQFGNDPCCRIAIIGITAGGVGLDLSAASIAVFVELPISPSWLRQAEDRLHRRGQTQGVHIYYLVLPPGSEEDLHWQRMRRLLKSNTSVINSKEQAEELMVHCMHELKTHSKPTTSEMHIAQSATDSASALTTQAPSAAGTQGARTESACIQATLMSPVDGSGFDLAHNDSIALTNEELCPNPLPPKCSEESGKASEAGQGAGAQHLDSTETTVQKCNARQTMRDTAAQQQGENSAPVSSLQKALRQTREVEDANEPQSLSQTGIDPDETETEVVLSQEDQLVSTSQQLPAKTFSASSQVKALLPHLGNSLQDPNLVPNASLPSLVASSSLSNRQGMYPRWADKASPQPATPVIHEIWFELSRYTNRLHLHGNPEGSQPLALQLDPFDYQQEAELAYQYLQDPTPDKLDAAKRIAMQLDLQAVLPAGLQLSLGARWDLLKMMGEQLHMTSRQRSQAYGRAVRSPIGDYLKLNPAPTKARAYLPSFRRYVKFSELLDGSRHGQHTVLTLLQQKGRPPIVVRQPLDSETGKLLCQRCGALRPLQLTPRTMADLMCSIECLNYVNCLRKGGLRKVVDKRDRGICEVCDLDCRRLVGQLQIHESQEARSRVILELAPIFASKPALLRRLARHPHAGNAWHVDHVLMVAEGGGECDEANARTLCVLCHANVTAEQLAAGRGRGCQTHTNPATSATRKRKRSMDRLLPVPYRPPPPDIDDFESCCTPKGHIRLH